MATEQNLERGRVQKWLEANHAASATLSAEHWCNNFFTSDITLQFGNHPPITGLSTLRDTFFAPQLACLGLMEHYVQYFDVVGQRIYQGARIRYRVKGDPDDGARDVEVPGFAVFDVREEKGEETTDGVLRCHRMEVYIDTRALEVRIAEVFGGEAKST